MSKIEYYTITPNYTWEGTQDLFTVVASILDINYSLSGRFKWLL